MYGCNCHIGCLSGSVTRVCEELRGEVARIGEGLKGYASLVCSTNRDTYLRVNSDVVWLTSDILSSGEFEIYSNVIWKID